MAETDQTEERCRLPPGTLAPCGILPTRQRDRVMTSEIVEVASGISREHHQTAPIFVWATNIDEISAIDAPSIDLFCDRLESIPGRFETNRAHFDRNVDEVIEATRAANLPTRDRSTISRHRSRMTKLQSAQVPEFEERVKPGFRVHLDSAECDAIVGWTKHAGFLAVTRVGRVVYGSPLAAFDNVGSATAAKKNARAVIEQARESVNATTEWGRACIATRHPDDTLRVIPGFWNTDLIDLGNIKGQ